MSCCGNKTRDAQRFAMNHASESAPAPASVPPAHATVVVVRYEGQKTLTGYGGATGKKYRFPPGVEVAIDIRDRPSLKNAPNLKEIRLA